MGGRGPCKKNVRGVGTKGKMDSKKKNEQEVKEKTRAGEISTHSELRRFLKEKGDAKGVE